MKDYKEKILIGGRAMIALGSSRNTLDIDYLVNDEEEEKMFIKADGEDYCNAAGFDLFKEIYEIEKGQVIASPQSLLELKAFAFVQHCRNGHWQKADDCEYDMKFLVRKFNLSEIKIAKKYLDEGAMLEINNIIKNVKR